MKKILHTGDVHLDSPFASLGYEGGVKARAELLGTFRKMMEYAHDKCADAVLISGDLFDCTYVSADTADGVVDALACAGCPVVIAPGNHDPYTASSFYCSGRLPDNVYVFSEEKMQTFDFDDIGISVSGYAFTSDRLEHNPVCDFEIPESAQNNIRILCAHAELNKPLSKYAPLTTGNIARCGFSYAALGHIHNAPQGIRAGSCLVSYCGFPSGRSFDENGFGGAMWVSIDDDGTACAEKIVFSEHRYLTCKCDISGAENNAQISDEIKKLISDNALGGETYLRVMLCGTVGLSTSPNCVALAKDCRSTLAGLRVEDSTFVIPDAESLEKDFTVRGELYRVLLPKLSGDDPDERRQAAQALRIGLFALDDRNPLVLLESNDENTGEGL